MDRRTLLVGAGSAFVLPLIGIVGADEGTDQNADAGSEETNDEAVAVGIGDLVEGEDIHLVVEAVETATELDEFAEAEVGTEFVIVRLAYKNVGDDFQSVSGWLSTRVHDDEDYSYDQSLYGTGEALDDGEIAPGEVERGNVVYEVPESATGLVLEFDFELGLFGSLERATIDLETESDEPHMLEQELTIDVHDVAETVEHEGTTVTVNEVETATELDEFTETEAGHEYVIVDVTVANDTGEEQRVSTLLQMQLKDEDGFSYGEELGASVALEQAFDEGTPIDDGDQRRGQVAYEVEAGKEPLYWVFEFALLDEGDKTFWQLR